MRWGALCEEGVDEGRTVRSQVVEGENRLDTNYNKERVLH